MRAVMRSQSSFKKFDSQNYCIDNYLASRKIPYGHFSNVLYLMILKTVMRRFFVRHYI